MSLDSWKEAHYPVDAESMRYVAELKAVDHSLLKWSGLRKPALDGHKVELLQEAIVIDLSDESLPIDASTCSLCIRHLKIFNQHFRECRTCMGCPVNSVLGHPCDVGEESPYDSLDKECNPEPLIKILEDARALVVAGLVHPTFKVEGIEEKPLTGMLDFLAGLGWTDRSYIRAQLLRLLPGGVVELAATSTEITKIWRIE